jgi:hypothetical protein
LIQNQKVDGSWALDVATSSSRLGKSSSAIRSSWTSWLPSFLAIASGELKSELKLTSEGAALATGMLSLLMPSSQNLMSGLYDMIGGVALQSRVRDSRHQHDLSLVMGAYKDKNLYMKCDICSITCSELDAPAYHCEPCGFDLHPECLTVYHIISSVHLIHLTSLILVSINSQM